MPELSEERARRLFELFVGRLKEDELEAPWGTESESAYTRRCLQPWLGRFLAELGFRGLVARGEGAAPTSRVHVMDLDFYPDLAISYFDDRVVAVEVKFLRGSQRQNSFATSVGQGRIYEVGGYRKSAIFLVETGGFLSDEGMRMACEEFEQITGMPLIVRRARRGMLQAAP